MQHYSSAAAAADVIKLYKPGFSPKFAVVLGSGLGPFAQQIKDPTVIPYYKLPGFPSASVKGHAGNLLLGYIENTPIVCLQGRVHIYEGQGGKMIKTIIRTMKLIGCEAMVITNAAGSLREEVPPGDLMLITDHINFQFTNVLIGPNDEEFGDRFVALNGAYDPELCEKVIETARKLDIKLATGVYLATSGPNFETAAEIKAFHTLGADAVGMSTVQETMVARHCGLKIVAISAITNLAEGMTKVPLSHEQTLAGAKLAADKLLKLLSTFIAELA